jgi:hypothetical protein
MGEGDIRPLGLYRIVVGALVLHDTLRRTAAFRAWHTDEGVLPRAAVFEGVARPWRFSLLDMMGPTDLVAVFFVFGAISALCLLLGYRTRLATFCTWIFLVSVQERNLGVTDSSDTVLRVMLFWLIFSPAGAAFSMDRALSDRPGNMRGSMVALRIMQLEIATLYYVTAVAKSGDHWRDGSALYRALQIWDFARPTASFYVEHLAFLGRPMAYGTLLLELALPFGLILPNLRFRKVVLLGGLGLHTGIELMMNVGMFSFVMMTTYILFLWPSAVDKIERRLPRMHGLTTFFRERLLRVVPDPAPVDRGWVGTPKNAMVMAVTGTLMGTIVWDQFHEVNSRFPRPPAPFVQVMESLSMWQNWRMFAPNPVFDAGPWTAEGVLTNGTKVDVLAHAAPEFAHPPDGRWLYTRWNKYRLHIRTPEQRAYLLWFGRYLCRQWNQDRRSGEPLLDHFELVYHLTQTHGIGAPANPPAPTMMWRHYCIKVPEG